MPSTRISEPTLESLRKLANASGDSMQAILDRAVEMYRRRRFLEESNRAYEALRKNPETWKDEEDERKAWDATLADGQEE